MSYGNFIARQLRQHQKPIFFMYTLPILKKLATTLFDNSEK